MKYQRGCDTWQVTANVAFLPRNLMNARKLCNFLNKFLQLLYDIKNGPVLLNMHDVRRRINNI